MMPQIRVAVVGTKFKGAAGMECAARARIGDAARLVRDHSNTYDANAIAVHLLGRDCGYLPKTHNSEIAAAMDAGATPVAQVVREGQVNRGQMRPEVLIEVSW